MALGIFYTETTKVVKVKNIPLGTFRVTVYIALLAFLIIYELWYTKGYQKSSEIQRSVTIKVKGSST